MVTWDLKKTYLPEFSLVEQPGPISAHLANMSTRDDVGWTCLPPCTNTDLLTPVEGSRGQVNHWAGDRRVKFGLKLARLATNGTNLGLFKISLVS